MSQIAVAMRKLCLLMALLIVSGCASGGHKFEGNVGVVDSARVLNETSSGKRAKDSLSAFSKNRQAVIEMDEKELRRMEVSQAAVQRRLG